MSPQLPQDKPFPHEDAELHKLKAASHHMEACRALLDLDDDVTLYHAIASMMVMVDDLANRNFEIQHFKEREAKLVTALDRIHRACIEERTLYKNTPMAVATFAAMEAISRESLNLDEKDS